MNQPTYLAVDEAAPRKRLRARPHVALALLLAATLHAPPSSAVTVGISANGRFFTLDGEPRFLVQASYYGALTVTDEDALSADLDELAAAGFNGIRVFVYWRDQATGENVSALTASGDPREPYLARLHALLDAADRRGLVVDCSLRRETGSTDWPFDLASHLRAVQTLAGELLVHRNVVIDIANERSIPDSRYVPMTEVGVLADAIHALDRERLVTASGNPQTPAELADHLFTGRLDFLAPHLCRAAACPAATRGAVETYVGWMEALGVRAPIDLQEPFRRGWNAFAPDQEDFLRDATGAKAAEAAGWCFHNGPQDGGRPYRSFSMNPAEGRLFAQLDAVERAVVLRVVDEIGGTSLERRRFHGEYAEQAAHGTGAKAGLHWSALPGRDAPGWLLDGPLYRMLDGGRYEARFRLRIADVTSDREPVLLLEVGDLDAPLPGRLAVRTVERDDFKAPAVWQDFVLPFANFGFGHRLILRASWPGNAAIDLDFVDLVARSPLPAPPSRTCLDESAWSPFSAFLTASLSTSVRLQDLVQEGYRDAAEMEAAGSWDFSAASGRDTFVQALPVDTAWSCSVGGSCGGFDAGRSLLLRTYDRPDSRERDAWAFGVDAAGRVLLRGIVAEEGAPGEWRTCFAGDAPWTEYARPGGCVGAGDVWTSPLSCATTTFTAADPCGRSELPLAGVAGSLSGRAIGGGVVTLPSGHVLDALLVEHLLDVDLRTPAGSCASSLERRRQHVLEWVVPHLGAAVQLRGPGYAADLSWQEAEDAVVAHGLLPPLSVHVASERTDSVTVTWDPGADSRAVDEYVVHWGTAPGAPQASSDLSFDVITREQTAYTIRDLEPGSTYHVSVSSRSRYRNPVSGRTTTYDSIRLPTSIGADLDGDGRRETSYPAEVAVHTRHAPRALLRGALPTLSAPPNSVLPLDPVGDVYVASFPGGDQDPEATVLVDGGRPLVFYAFSPARDPLRAVKTAALRIRLY